MRRFVSVAVAVAIASSLIPKPVKANPAVLPAALCSTGVGCVFVGVAIIGGVAVYIWRRNDGKRIHASKNGAILRIIDNPDEDGEPGVYSARNSKHCAKIAGGRRYEWLGNGKCKIWG